MDTPDKPKAGPQPADSEIDALAARLSSSWSRSPGTRAAAGQILQRLAHGRLHPVTVESRRPRRPPDRSR
jgi:hypothetical protein